MLNSLEFDMNQMTIINQIKKFAFAAARSLCFGPRNYKGEEV